MDPKEWKQELGRLILEKISITPWDTYILDKLPYPELKDFVDYISAYYRWTNATDEEFNFIMRAFTISKAIMEADSKYAAFKELTEMFSDQWEADILSTLPYPELKGDVKTIFRKYHEKYPLVHMRKRTQLYMNVKRCMAICKYLQEISHATLAINEFNDITITLLDARLTFQLQVNEAWSMGVINQVTPTIDSMSIFRHPDEDISIFLRNIPSVTKRAPDHNWEEILPTLYKIINEKQY